MLGSSESFCTLGEIAARAGASFGTSGVRGLVTSLTPELCAAYATAFLSILDPRPNAVLIGFDLRPSSQTIAAACHSAAHALRIETINCGVIPTPALAYAASKLGHPAIMVTGSHIPFDRNGMKFYRCNGEISKADEQRILSSPVNQPLEPLQLLTLPGTDATPSALYLTRYLDALEGDALEGMRIGIYEHSSVARDLLHQLFRTLGAKTIPLGRSDNFVAIDTEAVQPADRAIARDWVAVHRLDAIVATDGDADRPLIADERGEWIRGDILGLLCSRELRAGTVVTPLNSTTAIEASGLFKDVRRTRIGSPYVIAAMEKPLHLPVVGFEANGGFLLGSPAHLGNYSIAPLPTRDAVLPLLVALSAAKRRGCTISQLNAGLPQRHTYSGRLQEVDLRSFNLLLEEAQRSMSGMLKLFDEFPVTTDVLDGLRATFSNGTIIHLRPSGNAPELRCYAEASNAQEAEQLCEACTARIAGLLRSTSVQ